MRIRRLLCPIDFSEVSTHALEQAAAIARRSGASVTALAVLPSLAPEVAEVASETAGVAGGATEETERWRALAQTQCRAVSAAAVDVTVEVVEAPPVDAILDRAATLGADVIVMGTHGAGGVRHLVLGSVTEKVLRRATCPVLTVPPRVHSARASSFGEVLVAVDFSPCSLKAVDVAIDLARESQGRLTLLHVVEWPWHEDPGAVPEGVPPTQAAALLDYRRYLESGALERLARLAPSEVRAATTVRFGKPWKETLEAAAATGADVIVLGVQGRGAIDLGFFGSTTNHVVRSATCPVLTVRT